MGNYPPEKPREGDDRLSFENGSLSIRTNDFDGLGRNFS
jgi:hypothetical protein